MRTNATVQTIFGLQVVTSHRKTMYKDKARLRKGGSRFIRTALLCGCTGSSTIASILGLGPGWDFISSIAREAEVAPLGATSNSSWCTLRTHRGWRSLLLLTLDPLPNFYDRNVSCCGVFVLQLSTSPPEEKTVVAVSQPICWCSASIQVVHTDFITNARTLLQLNGLYNGHRPQLCTTVCMGPWREIALPLLGSRNPL